MAAILSGGDELKVFFTFNVYASVFLCVGAPFTKMV